MAILRVSDGRVMTAIEDINSVVKPMEIGRFPFSEELRSQVEAMPQPLSAEDANLIVNSLDNETRERLKSEGYVSWRMGNVIAEDNGTYAFHQHFEGGETKNAKKSAQEMADYLV